MQVTSTVVVQRLAAACCCSGCGALYDPRDIYVLARHGGRSWELAAICRRCCTLSLFCAFLGHRASGRRCLPSSGGEFSGHEQHRFEDMPPLDQTDVQAATEFLAAFDGDFRRLFERRPVDSAS